MITIVSGLPRSGTSMMMKMLEAGGMQILTDNLREADEDNLKGYYEYERAKQLDRDKKWIKAAEGKVVKVISYLLTELPREHQYRIIFMQRNIEEVLASQKKMMQRRKESVDEVPDTVMATLFKRHLAKTYQWLNIQPNMRVHYVSYNEVLRDPAFYAEEINEFLFGELDVEKMIQIVDINLYRHRK